MFQIYVPTTRPDDWQGLLTDPHLHWRTGYSARTLAYCWEHYKERGFPPEIMHLFASSGIPLFQDLTPLLALPEHHVFLPGGTRASQNDLFVLAKDRGDQLVSMTIEGKVNEPFGPMLAEWLVNASPGKRERLAFLQALLGLAPDLPSTIRYQLLHRTGSALLEAKRFNAHLAIMLVHSFSPDNRWFEDYHAFARLFGLEVTLNQLTFDTRD
jgi:hypothetical protein